MPIRWSLKSIETGEVASSGEVESIDSSGWSAAHVYRKVGTVKVQPGRYAFRAEVLRPVPDLANMRTQIAIQLKPKGRTTWQMGLVWWGAIGQYLLAWPLVAYAGVLLVWRAGLTLLSSGTPANGPLLDKLRKDATRESDPELRRQRLAKVDEIESAVHDVDKRLAAVKETLTESGSAGGKRFFSWIQFIYGLGAVAALVVSLHFQLSPAAWIIVLCAVIFGMFGIHLLIIKSRVKRLERSA